MSNKEKKVVPKTEVVKKKITFFSAILLVIGSSIGAGIFLKNREILGNVGSSIILTMVSWIISIIGVVCMGVSLVEISSADGNSNLGIISWVKNFCHKYLYKVSKYFMAILYLPLNFFLMPYYVVMQFQDAFGWQTTWWLSMIIALLISTYFLIIAGLSSKLGNLQNQIVTYMKFIPLVFCVLVGLGLGLSGHGFIGQSGGPNWISTPDQNKHHLLQKVFPMMGILASIPGIIFSFDGFYSAAGIQTEMQEPKKTPLAIVLGILIVSIIDLLVAIGLIAGSKDGSINSLEFFNDHNMHWLIASMQILIGFGILGIINGIAMYTPRFFEDLIALQDLPFSKKFQNKVNPNCPVVGLIYCGIITFVFFVVFSIVGAIGYSDVSGYSTTSMINFKNAFSGKGYESQINGIGNCNYLYSFCDLMANWTSILAFLCIVFALIGGIINRNKNKIHVTKVKGFVPCAIIASCVIAIGILFIVVQTIANIVIVHGWKKDIGLTLGGDTIYQEKDWKVDMLGSIMTLVILLLFVLVTCLPSAWEMYKEKKNNQLVKNQSNN